MYAIAAAMLGVNAAAHATCFSDASRLYAIPEPLLRAVATVESGGNARAYNLSHQSKTKSYDVGLMQVNSSWLPALQQYGIHESHLLDPCQNVLVGAWILAQHLRESGNDWNGVGSYNASCRSKSAQDCANVRNQYAWRVYRAWVRQTSPSQLSGVARPSAPAATPAYQPSALDSPPLAVARRIRSIDSNQTEHLRSATRAIDQSLHAQAITPPEDLQNDSPRN